MENVNTDSVLSEQIIKLILNTWTSQNKAVTNFLNKHSEDVYLNEVSPNRNRGIYLIGHLIATNDSMLPLLGLGEKLYPQLEAMFVTSTDKSIADIPSINQLKDYWETVNLTLTEHFNKMQPNEWLARHTKVSEEDFAIDPKRNKLNILIGRTNHQSYHFGQLSFLTPRAIVA